MLSTINADRWQVIEGNIYQDINRDAFCSVNSINIVFDPSNFDAKETGVGLQYSWEKQTSCHMTPVRIPVKSIILPSDVPMSNVVLALAKNNKLERQSAYRNMQSLLASMFRSSRKQIYDFSVPDEFVIRPLQHGEERVVVPDEMDPTFVRATLLHTASGTCIDCLPDTVPDNIACMTLGTDRGGIGAAGTFFLEGCNSTSRGQRRYVVHGYFDSIHRAIRAIKNTMNHSANGVYLQTVLWTTFVWNLNFRPHNNGKGEEEKQAILNYWWHILRIETIHIHI